MEKFSIKEIQNGIVIENIENFEARHIFECGQCFRWIRENDGSYTGIAFGKVINVLNIDCNKVIINNTNIEDFYNIWVHYFDLSRDYRAIKILLSQDEVMRNAIEFGHGIRILNQSPWEILISFIVSANNSIPLISRSLNILCEKYGDPVAYNGKTYFTFPKPERLFNLDILDIAICRAGFRCKYIFDAVQKVRCGDIDLSSISKLPIDKAREELMKVNGVGPKVADCIMLFSMQKHEAYPVDVWVKRVTEYYFLGKDVKMKEIQSFANEKFGELAGFAQQYLFYFAREMKIKP